MIYLNDQVTLTSTTMQPAFILASPVAIEGSMPSTNYIYIVGRWCLNIKGHIDDVSSPTQLYVTPYLIMLILIDLTQNCFICYIQVSHFCVLYGVYSVV